MYLKELLKEYSYTTTLPADTDIAGITRKPDQIGESCLYFHLKPSLKFTPKEKPAAIVLEKGRGDKIRGIPTVTLKNIRRAYSVAESNFNKIDYSKMIFIGITGTNGKTSTAIMQREILRSAGYKVGYIGTGRILSEDKVLSEKSYSMTTPDPEVLYPALRTMADDGCDIVIMEVSSHALALDKTYPIPFSLAIFTGLSRDHLDFHSDMEGYFLEKEKLIRKAKHAIINADDAYGRRLLLKYASKSIGTGILWQRDVSATDIEYSGLDGLKYIYNGKGHKTLVELKTPGYFNIYNSLQAIAAATSLGVTPKVCKDALRGIKAINGRFDVIRGDIYVITDYAHTPKAIDSLLKSLYFAQIPRQKITFVFGCGGERDKEKRPLMARAAECGAGRVIVTTDNSRSEDPRVIISDIVSGFESASYAIIPDRETAIEYAILTAKDGDAVVIAGKGAEPYIYDNGGYREFDERAVIERALIKRKGTE